MESRLKPGAAGFDSSFSRRSYMNSGALSASASASTRAPAAPVDGCCVSLRVFVLVSTLLAAVLMGVDRQTTTTQAAASNANANAADADAMQVEVTAKLSFSTAFVYFVFANAVVFAFSGAALAACRSRSAVVPVMVGDLVALALLFSAVGAAAQFGILGERGNSHVRWAKVCDVYGQFCERAMAAVAVSLIAAFADLVLLMLTILTIHKASSYY